jgi:hypothetical protein
MKFFAIPLRADGTEYMGTEGVLSGEYQSAKNFIKYNLSRNARISTLRPTGRYNIETYYNGRWSHVRQWSL